MDWDHDNDFSATLLKNLPMMKRGYRYYFEMESGHVYRHHEERSAELIGPLRTGLAGYLWLLSTESKWMKKDTNM